MKINLFIILFAILLLPFFLLISPLIIPIVLVFLVLFLKINYATIKGAAGERHVNRILNQLNSNYKVYHDLYVPNKRGGTTQIDHVVTSPFGVFVIETKNYDGWIFGDENQKYWTQVIFKRKEKLFNPIWQNYGHMKALKHYIGEDFEFIHSIVAFSPRATFKFKGGFKSARVIQYPQLVKVIMEWNIYKIGHAELQQINRALDRLILTDKKEKRELKRQHVQAIKIDRQMMAKKEIENIEQNVCPKCGGALSLRKGKYGAFYGCSNYPKCRYTKRVS
ncbi:NERD domain-containing protein [Neobacillus mesonae]|uniref:NERD domain-containing protein n=1 Tax=Neobacillus mesonae TaxID=1193713 RepID=UPI002E1DBEA5|nr:NERD domain-containing protein [Neobacillus mesonae]